jgi:hypothetical protein
MRYALCADYFALTILVTAEKSMSCHSERASGGIPLVTITFQAVLLAPGGAIKTRSLLDGVEEAEHIEKKLRRL